MEISLFTLKAKNMKTTLEWLSSDLQSAAHDGIRVMPKCFQSRFITISICFQQIHTQIAPGNGKQDTAYFYIDFESGNTQKIKERINVMS